MSKIITQKCKVENCESPGRLTGKSKKRYFTRGYCGKHYSQLCKIQPLSWKSKTANRHILYTTYRGMKERCYNNNSISYIWYGARGITVCDRWLGKDGFWNFVEDMGKRPEGHTLDRIDNTKEYSPDNCKWSTVRYQNANRRNSNDITGVSYSKRDKLWVAKLTVNGLYVMRKSFKAYNDAVKYRREAESIYLKG